MFILVERQIARGNDEIYKKLQCGKCKTEEKESKKNTERISDGISILKIFEMFSWEHGDIQCLSMHTALKNQNHDVYQKFIMEKKERR